MRTNLKFSIITVTKNNKAGLLRAIECVRNQTYKNVEHIIVDGGSKDGTKEMMDDGRWKMEDGKFISEPDEGIYDAINKGIKSATGDVIGLLHSDDLYADENVIGKYASVFDQPTANHKQPTIDAVYSDLVYVKNKSNVKSQKSIDQTNIQSYNHSILRYWKTQDKEFTTEAQRHRAILNGWMPPHPTLFLRREIFEKYGLYNTDLKIASDYEMILRLFYMNKITSCYLPLTTYLMSTGGASNRSITNILQKSKEDHSAMKIHNIPSPMFTLISKNLRKLPQFLARGL
jgi:glycosyltransferase involved in cell wall biosynthesis